MVCADECAASAAYMGRVFRHAPHTVKDGLKPLFSPFGRLSSQRPSETHLSDGLIINQTIADIERNNLRQEI